MSKRYRMKQSLPWLPKGSEFEIKFDDNGKPYMQRENSKLLAECYETTINYFFIDDFDEFCPENIIDSNWIEEIKLREPREIFEISTLCGDGKAYYPDIESARESRLAKVFLFNRDYKITKFIEVLE